MGRVRIALDAQTPRGILDELVRRLPEDYELQFYDRDFPSPSEPGAYIVVTRSPPGFTLFRGNHGWQSPPEPTTAAAVTEYLFACREHARDLGEPTACKIMRCSHGSESGTSA